MRMLILGCGWVGEYVARKCLALGHQVYVTTRTEETYLRLKSEGIFPFIHDFDQANPPLQLPVNSFDWVLNSIPATQKNTLSDLSHRFIKVRDFLGTLTFEKHIFLSSIGIYPDVDREITEDTFPKSRLQEKLLLAENALSDLSATSYIFRLGGLFGENRIFAKYFQHRICETGNQPANFIHIADVSNLIVAAFENKDQLLPGIYNLVAPEHPSKKEVVLASAAKYNYALPSSFKPADLPAKIVLGTRIQERLNYTFIYSNPIDF